MKTDNFFKLFLILNSKLKLCCSLKVVGGQKNEKRNQKRSALTLLYNNALV